MVNLNLKIDNLTINPIGSISSIDFYFLKSDQTDKSSSQIELDCDLKTFKLDQTVN